MHNLPQELSIALKAHVSKCLQTEHNPYIAQIDNKLYVIKAQRREAGRTRREYTSALACLLLFGRKVKPKLLRTGNIHHEARRIRELHSLGLNVPTLICEGSNYIVMEHCGECLEVHLSNANDPTSLLAAITDELLKLHKLGQWHGGAQVRNLTLSNGKIYRIDFEENTGNALPLYMAQAYDALLCFSSLTPYWNNQGDLSVKLITHYLQSLNNQNINRTLFRLNSYLKLLQRVVRISQRVRQPKNDITYAMYFSDSLEQSLKSLT